MYFLSACPTYQKMKSTPPFFCCQHLPPTERNSTSLPCTFPIRLCGLLCLQHWYCFSKEAWPAVTMSFSKNHQFPLMGVITRMGISPTFCLCAVLRIKRLSATLRSTYFLCVLLVWWMEEHLNCERKSKPMLVKKKQVLNHWHLYLNKSSY